MRKLVLPFVAGCLVLCLAGCSSSKHSSSATSTTTSTTQAKSTPTLDAATTAKLCTVNTQLTQLVANPGTSASEFQADATKLRSMADTLGSAPASLADSSKEVASTLTSAATKLETAANAAAAKTVLAQLILTPNAKTVPFTDWVKTNCK